MGLARDARAKQLDTSTFWHIIFPVLVIIILLFVLFVIFTLPDWAISCSSKLVSIQSLAKAPST